MNEIDKGFEQVAAIREKARSNAFRKVKLGVDTDVSKRRKASF